MTAWWRPGGALVFLLTVLAMAQQPPAPPATAAAVKEVPHGRLETLNGYRVLTVDGTPAEMGRAYGTLVGDTVRRVVADLITNGVAADADARRNLHAGSAMMARFQPPEYLEELQALAAAAAVKYEDLLLLQYFGDVARAIEGPGHSPLCTSFAVLPPAAAGRTCIVGRNFDYFDRGIGDYASLLVVYRPAGRLPFVTVTWAGVANGWTLLNAKGVAVSNNTAFGGGAASLEGLSTCYLLRHVAERAATVPAGVELVKRAARACATNMLIAGGEPPAAVIVEFDHTQVVVRAPMDGLVAAANSFLQLGEPAGATPYLGGRLERVHELVTAERGKVTLASKLAGADGVPIVGMNLHSVMLDTSARRLRVAMGRIPAFRLPYRAFRLSAAGELSADEE